MKFIHLSDLHLGKRVNEFSMTEDQQFILTRIINIIDEEEPDGVLIAGDVYDRSVPSEEAMQLWDDFLLRLKERSLQVFVISGNHDSQVRLSLHEQLIEGTGIHISPVYNGQVKCISLKDGFGCVNVYMLPFVKPVNVRQFFDEDISSYTDAVRCAIAHMGVDAGERNVLMAHQFITGAGRCDSEEINVGGLDNVDASVFDDFDYVALGHIHGSQHIMRDTIRYCGTPLKYSLSEKDQVKSVTVVELKEKGSVDIREIPLIPKHDLREISGTYAELTLRENYTGTATDDYLHVVLTDEEDVPDAMAKLRLIYPNIMGIEYRNRRTMSSSSVTDAADIDNKSPLELLDELYEKQNNQPMSSVQRELAAGLIDSIWGGDV